jgi:ElaB/YqjD/DUF883 family membrane-anchored ribosome-binding protein
MEATAAVPISNRTATDQFREKASQVREDIRELSSVAKEAAAEKFDRLYKEGREKVVQFEHGLENQIRMHPLQAVAIAAGVGFLAGYLVSRRR